MGSKDIPMYHKAKRAGSGYTYHCPACDAMWEGYPLGGCEVRCKKCGQVFVFEEFTENESDAIAARGRAKRIISGEL